MVTLVTNILRIEFMKERSVLIFPLLVSASSSFYTGPSSNTTQLATVQYP